MSSTDSLMQDTHDTKAWWRGGVIYQIYPRSFMDSRGDGIGDLPGVTEKLDYVASLNVDGIWLSPFFTSPMLDFGYDISNYRDVDPMFGTLDDFKALLAKAHRLGLKVMIDQVISHTSDQHAWFQESRQDRTNPKADWFVWADPKPDGTPPNNWLSIFGGPAWTFEPRRQQYYMHNFLTSQPDVNFHNPEARQAQLDNMRFWLELGVDGFRLDTVNFFFHDKELRNNPPVPKGEAKTLGAPDSNPYTWQRHVYDLSRPENLDFLKDLRALMDEYPGTTTVGEIGDDNPLERMAEYTAGGDKLHMAYTFDLLNKPHSAAYLREVIERFQRLAGDAWPCWATSNHDVERSARAGALTRIRRLILKSPWRCCFHYAAASAFTRAKSLACLRPMCPLNAFRIPTARFYGPNSRDAMAVARRCLGMLRPRRAFQVLSHGCQSRQNIASLPLASNRATRRQRSMPHASCWHFAASTPRCLMAI